jgi:Tol biopolymer transport system component
LKKIRDGAHDAGLSPDGSQVIYCNDDNTALGTMNVDGSQARAYFTGEPGAHLYYPSFINGGSRVAFIHVTPKDGRDVPVLESRNLQGQDPVTLSDNGEILDYTFTQPGRLIYSASEPPPHERDSNLWEISYDTSNGRPTSEPRRLTDWTGFTFLNPSISLDGKHFAFLNQRDQSAVFVGELGTNNEELKNPQRLTLNENYNWATGWSADSKAVYFHSNRNGLFDIYKQGLNERTAETVVSGEDEKLMPQLSPDGNWILYMQFARAMRAHTINTGKLMRIAVGGGAPEFVMDVTGAHAGPYTLAQNGILGYPNFRCPRAATAPCLLAERKGSDIVFTAFDPLQGRKSEVAKHALRPGPWDLSPDGSQIAIAEFSYTGGQVELIPIHGGAHQKLSAMPWTEITNLSWAADGKSLFLNSFSSRGSSIVHLNMNGQSKLLYKTSWELFQLSASPDGKYLAFGPEIYDSNAWALGYFPAK